MSKTLKTGRRKSQEHKRLKDKVKAKHIRKPQVAGGYVRDFSSGHLIAIIHNARESGYR